MSGALQLEYLDNVTWKKEVFLSGHVVIHSVRTKKISDHVSTKLQENNFKIVDIKKDQTLSRVDVNMIEGREIEEVQLEKVRVTEASIVSHTASNGKTRKVIINESEPATPVPQDKAVVTTTNFKKIENETFIFRQEVTRQKNSYFFRAKDGPALFKLGNSFYESYKSGTKYFSFSNIQSNEAQKSSILGIASFIHYHDNVRILIVCPEMKNSVFSGFAADENKATARVSAIDNFQYSLFSHEGLNYLEISEVKERCLQGDIKDQVYVLENIMNDYDLVFFDLPDTKEMKAAYEIYFPVLQLVQNVSIIVGMGKSSFTEIKSLQEFFENYKVKVNGVILSDR